MTAPYDPALAFVHWAPTKIVYGNGSVREAALEVEALGGSRAFIVTDTDLASKTDLPERARLALGPRYAGTFSEVEPESAMVIVERGAEAARSAGADCLVSVGGGSAMDTAKAIAILLTLGGTLREHEGYHFLDRSVTPHLAIPTTAGTGSEVTIFAVIRDEERGGKMHLADNHLAPEVAILDPELTLGLPPALTAGTGMDVLTHAIEALQSPMRQPVADALALHAVRLVARHLARAVEAGDDLAARGQMLLASTLAGLAFSNAQVGLVHALAHTVGPRYRIHHGTANALFLPHVIRFNAEQPEVAERYRAVAEALGMEAGPSPGEAARAVAEGCEALARRVALPRRLGTLGVPREALAELAELTLADGAVVYNPRPIADAREVLPLWEAAF